MTKGARPGGPTGGETIEPVEIGVECIFCGGPTAFRYEDRWGIHGCTGCHARCVREYPPEQLSKEELPVARLANRTPNEVYEAHRIWEKHREASVMDGIRPECSGDMPVVDLRFCTDHEPDPSAEEVCASCQSIFWGVAIHVCGVCKSVDRIPTFFYPSMEPAVIAFYHERGIDFDIATADSRSRIIDYDERLVSEDPPRIRTTLFADGDELYLEYDRAMRVVAVSD